MSTLPSSVNPKVAEMNSNSMSIDEEVSKQIKPTFAIKKSRNHHPKAAATEKKMILNLKTLNSEVNWQKFISRAPGSVANSM